MKLRFLSALLILAVSPVCARATTIEISNYGYALGNSDLNILHFETGSTGYSTPPDISMNPSFDSAAQWYGAGTLQYFASNGIPADQFGQQYLGNLSAYPRHTDISAAFPGTVNFVGSWVMWAGNLNTIQTIQFTLYGTSDQVIYSKLLSAPQAFDQIYYFGVYSDQAISRAVWHPMEDSFFDLDNLTYGTTTSPVPAPASIWLLSLGLFFIMILRAKRALPESWH